MVIANMNIKNFKNFLIEVEEKPVKTETPKSVPNIGVGNKGQIKAPVKVEEDPKQTTPPTQTTQPQQPKVEKTEPNVDSDDDDPFEGNEQLKKVYGSIAYAEHSAEFAQNKKRPALTDPFAFSERLYRRTDEKSGVSSAYGPVQIVKKTAEGFFKARPDLFKGNEDYTKRFIEQGNKFLKAKGTPGKYGPGCVGDLCDPKEHKAYQKLAVSVIKGKAAEKKIDLSKPLSEKDLETFVSYWRGRTKDQDPRYFNEFNKQYQSSNN
jgi:hypothetical protein